MTNCECDLRSYFMPTDNRLIRQRGSQANKSERRTLSPQKGFCFVFVTDDEHRDLFLPVKHET